jgi:tetratricopeptide (TPR) repeat protein
VRADYKNWMRACAAAYHSENWELCWRIATFFGGPVPDRPDGDQCDRVFKFAERAALQGQVAWAPVEVLLAKGTFLLALERYGEALATFDVAAQAIDSLKVEPGHEERALRFDAVRHRKMAEGWIQLGAYGRADIELIEALSIFRRLPPGIELDRVLLLKEENESRTALDRQKYEGATRVASPESDDALWFRRQLLLSESARRERNWSSAAQYLQIALVQNYGDTRRTANVYYRLARLRLNQARHVNIHEQSIGLAWDSVGFAATALNAFRDMKNTMGVVRSRSLLARALVVAEQLTEAQDEIGIAQSELNAISRSEGEFINPLRARLSLAQGEIWLHQLRYAEASQILSDAVARFGSEEDRRSQIEALLLRGVAERYEKRFASSNITLWAVAAAFKASGDDAGAMFALEQLALTAEEMRQFGTAMELRMLAHNGSVKRLSPLMAITLARSLYAHRGGKRSDPLAHDHDVHLPV